MKIVIGSDKSGFALKEALKKDLLEKGYLLEDCGTLSMDAPLPYFAVAPIAAQKLQSGECGRGILICGTGMGMAIIANKYQGVYAAVCENTYAAEKCRAINDANVLTLGGWITGEFVGCEIVKTFLSTAFTENLEEWRKEFLTNARKEVYMLEDKIYG